MSCTSPSSSCSCSVCSGTTSSYDSSSCDCSAPLTYSQNSSIATPTCSFNSILLSNYRSPSNFSVNVNELLSNDSASDGSLDGANQLSEDVDETLCEDDNSTHLDSNYEENRMEDFETYVIEVKNENISEEEQESEIQELFITEDVPDGVVLGEEEIWIPPVESQDVENVFAMENSVPYE